MRRLIVNLVLVVVAIAGIVIGVTGAIRHREATRLTEAAFAYTPPTATEPVKPSLTAETLYQLVRPCARLITADQCYVMSDTISEHAKPLGFNLTFFRDEVDFTYRGTISFGIYLADVSFEVDQANRVIRAALPEAAIISHAIDTSSFVFDTKRDSWFTEIDPDVFVARANSLKHEQEVQAIASGDAIRDASRSAESALRSLLAETLDAADYRLTFTTAG